MKLFHYLTFAIISTVLNLSSQYFYVQFFPIQFLKKEAAILIGTAVGLVIKYILDKLFVFKMDIKNGADEIKTFTLYTLMGVLTTIIFWGTEYSFIYFYPEDENAMYIGAILGLSIGYIIKYNLDKKYVFNN